MYYQVVLPYLVTSVFWCPYPNFYTVPYPVFNGHAPQFSGFGNSNPGFGFGFGLNPYQPPIFSYSSCKIGTWKPHSCIDCYCVNGYASRCTLNPQCPDSNSNSGASPTTTTTTATMTTTSSNTSESTSNMTTNDENLKSKRGTAPVSASVALHSLHSRRESLVSIPLSTSVSLADPDQDQEPGNSKRTTPIVTNNFLLNTEDTNKDYKDIKDAEQKSNSVYENIFYSTSKDLHGMENTGERKETTTVSTVIKSIQGPESDDDLPERRMHDFNLLSNVQLIV